MPYTPLPQDFADGQKVNGARLNTLIGLINTNLESIDPGGSGESPAWSPFINVKADHGAIGDGVANDTTAFAAALAAADASGSKKIVWVDAGIYLIATGLVCPLGITLLGPGSYHAILRATAAITLLTVGVTMTGEGDRYGIVEGIRLDCNNVGKIGLYIAALCVERAFQNCEVRNATEYNYQVDGAQNCKFTCMESKGGAVGWRLCNDPGSNHWDRCETESSTVSAMVWEDDEDLPAYDWNGGAGLFGHAGPSNNHWTKCLFEYGSCTTYLDGKKGVGNVFDDCDFTGYGNGNVQAGIDLGSDCHLNTFNDCKFNFQFSETAIAAIRNAGYRNRIVNAHVTCPGLGSGVWCTTSNAIELIECHLAGSYTVEHTGFGDTKAVMFRPKADQQYGNTASRPDFGQVGVQFYWNTQTNRPNWKVDGVWYDPAAGGGGGGGATPIVGDVPSGAKNGINTVFTTSSAYAAGTVAVYLNGLREINFTETGSGTTITFDDAPASSDTIVVDYFLP